MVTPAQFQVSTRTFVCGQQTDGWCQDPEPLHPFPLPMAPLLSPLLILEDSVQMFFLVTENLCILLLRAASTPVPTQFCMVGCGQGGGEDTVSAVELGESK